MNTKIKTLLTVLVILSMMTTAVNAGNIGEAVTNTVTTFAEMVEYITTIDITSPVDGTRFGTTSVDIGYGTTNTSAQVNYTLNGVYMGAAGNSPFTVTGSDDGTDGGKLNTVILNVTDPKNGSAQDTVTFKVDTTAPAQVTGIGNTKGTNYVNWTWTPPTNTDFNNVIVNVTKTSDSSIVVPDTDVPKGTNYYNATGLVPNTEYTMSIRTEDDAPAS